MKSRRKRIDLMVDLIKNYCISSQEDLSQMLAERGYKVTQATLSRDLKMLKTTKVPTDRGTYMYIMPDHNSLKDKLLSKGATDISSDIQTGIISLDVSGNIAIIKTRNGYAMGLAYDIDMSHTSEIMGTIAGSDTIFAVMREGVTPEQTRALFNRLLSIENNHHLR